jgi:mannose/fructose/N-acetylgalactosamine-specific phosphotransferase system component IIB
MGETNVVNMNNFKGQRLTNKNVRVRKMIYQIFKNLKKNYMEITLKYIKKTVSTVKKNGQYWHINRKVLLLEYQILHFTFLIL